MTTSRRADYIFAFLAILAFVNAQDVFVANTFEDSIITGGEQTIYQTDGPAPIEEGGPEFRSFPAGLYDIDVNNSSIKFTLMDNSAASNLVLPEDRFDRYYFDLPFKVDSAVVDGPKSKIAEYTSVKILPPGFSLDVADLFGTGVNLPIEFPSGGILVEVGPGADLTDLGQEIYIVLNPEVFVANTFEDSIITGGEQTIFQTDGPTLMDSSTEFKSFPAGLYDIDVSPDSIKFTLMDNSAASDLVLPKARFDRYYLDLPFHVASAVVDGPKSKIAEYTSVKILPPGFILDVADLFGAGVDLPIDFPSGALLVEVGPGADLTELGQEINIVLNPKVFVANTFQSPTITVGLEVFFQTDGPTLMDGTTEFKSFPVGLYDIDVCPDSVKYTLMDNSAASDLVLPDSTFDRYYFDLPFEVASALVNGPKSKIAAHTSVKVLPAGFSLDVVDLFGFCEGVELPIEYPSGALLVQIGPGADLTDVGQEIDIVLNPKVFVANTFEDSIITGGEQTIFQTDGPTLLDDKTEFVSFPAGLYDIDVTPNRITFTLMDNSAASDLVLPEARFDRYYFNLPFHVTNAVVEDPKGLISKYTSVKVLPPGFSLDVADLFGAGVDLPIDFPSGALLVEVGSGADLSVLGETIEIGLNMVLVCAEEYQPCEVHDDCCSPFGCSDYGKCAQLA